VAVLSVPDAPVGDWLEAAARRLSRRSYDGRPVAEDALAALESVCERFRSAAEVRTVLAREAPPDMFRGILGSYGRISGAPSALAFVGPAAGEDVPVAIGYSGETAVLEATRLGLGTCWVSGLFRRSTAAAIADCDAGEAVWAVSPVGYPRATLSGAERLLYRQKPGRARHRLAAGEIAPGIGSAWPDWACKGVEAARHAPSAANRQPWRFRYEGDHVVIAYAGPESVKYPKRLDCGIAMLHFELAARASGVPGSWLLLAGGADVASWVVE